MFICARVYLGRGMVVGVRVQSGEAGAQLGVCIHDLCGLYTQKGGMETTFLAVGAKAISLHVRMRLILLGMLILYKKCHITTYRLGDVLL